MADKSTIIGLYSKYDKKAYTDIILPGSKMPRMRYSIRVDDHSRESNRNYFAVLLLIFILFNTCDGGKQVQSTFSPMPCYSSDVDAILAFGDSYSFVQGTAGRSGYSFIGDKLNYAFSADQLFSSQIRPNRTSAGGPNWLEYLTGCYKGYPRDCGTELWDFSFSGAIISEKYIAKNHDFTLTFEDQVQQWRDYAYEALALDPSRTLVTIFIGINDVLASPHLEGRSFFAFYSDLTAIIFDSVNSLYDRGFRNYLVLNVPPLDRSPYGYSRDEVLHVPEYNDALYSVTKDFHYKHADVQLTFFDTYEFFNTILDNPDKYCILDTKDYCKSFPESDIDVNSSHYSCLSKDKYFWHGGYISFATYKLYL
ncbi:carbohydrate esterase family 16 protein [Dipodascopsis uninucleata]